MKYLVENITNFWGTTDSRNGNGIFCSNGRNIIQQTGSSFLIM